MKTLFAALLLSMMMPAIALASDALDRAGAAQALLGTAAQKLADAETAPDRITALTAAVRAYEAGLESLRESVRQAAVRERVIRESFEAERAQVAQLLGALQTVERTPDPVRLVHPSGPLGAARAGMMVSDLTPDIARRALELRTRLEELNALQQVQASANAELQAGLDGVQTARLALSDAVARRVRVPVEANPDPVVLGLLSAASETLDQFVSALTKYDLPAAAKGFSDRQGRLNMPLPALVLHGFDAPDKAGIRRPGLVLAARDRTLVSTPAAASVRYVGTLLDYGNVIVLEPEPRYLLILAGLEEVYVSAGEIVAEDAPLGLMGGTGETPVRFAGGQGRQETLYLELRHDGQPVDPAQWFVTDKD